MFKPLSDVEIKIFRQWARANYKEGDEIPDIWHPIVREECDKMVWEKWPSMTKDEHKALMIDGIRPREVNC